MKIDKRIEQSRARAKSGTRLVSFLLAAMLIAFVLEAYWVTQLLGYLAGFFLLVTLVEFWNGWILKRHLTHNK
ncbi:hypothetical protein LDO32_05445 [Luteimonas sp. Y-2-2-4F]|nr:hypothetical protein [Luteimonas sp. Y-2-2-4F]MCD9031174.1 hypothetical protein [Luteimonas sp. Y-2-2-4F]